MYKRTFFSFCCPSFLLHAKDLPNHRTALTLSFLAGRGNSWFVCCFLLGPNAQWAGSVLFPPAHIPLRSECTGDLPRVNLPSRQFGNFSALLRLVTIPCFFSYLCHWNIMHICIYSCIYSYLYLSINHISIYLSISKYLSIYLSTKKHLHLLP